MNGVKNGYAFPAGTLSIDDTEKYTFRMVSGGNRLVAAEPVSIARIVLSREVGHGEVPCRLILLARHLSLVQSWMVPEALVNQESEIEVKIDNQEAVQQPALPLGLEEEEEIEIQLAQAQVVILLPRGPEVDWLDECQLIPPRCSATTRDARGSCPCGT